MNKKAKEKFIESFDDLIEINKMVIAIRLPSGAIELIINTEGILSKLDVCIV